MINIKSIKKMTIGIVATTLIAMCASTTTAKNAKTKQSDLRKSMITFDMLVKELAMNYVDTLDYEELIESAIAGLLYNVDPYTEYLKKEEQNELKSLSAGKFGGIGSIITKRGDRIVINEPQDGTPSLAVGLRHGDRILAIDGDTIASNADVGEVSNKLRGKPGTTLRVDISRPYVDDSLLSFDITRADIKVNPITYHGMITPSVGYIKLATFSENVADEFRKAVSELASAPGIKGLIVDLRDNTGGLLEAAVSAASCFVPRSTEIVRVKYKNNDNKVYRTTRKPITETLPLVLLTNGMTASSSEILSGSLQDLDRAVVMGERSYGKGLVQSSRPLPDGALLKVTIGKYYIPSGRLIQAINYADRDENNNVKRIPDSLTNVFKTRLGREVRDGGGITPDTIVASPQINRLIYNIISDYWAYDFATKYRAEHPDAIPSEKFEVDSTIFAEFKAFIDPAKFKYDRQVEAGLKYLEEAAKIEGYSGDSIKSHLEALASLMKHDLNHDLEFNRRHILTILDNELSGRYYGQRERQRRSLKDDRQVAAAIALLNDRAKYDSMLRPKESRETNPSESKQ